MALSYRELDMYQIAFDLFIKTHNFSLELPKHELYELGSQLRRSLVLLIQISWRGMVEKHIKMILLSF